MKNRRSTLAILGLLFTLGVPGLPLSKWENEFAGVSHLVGYEVVWWAIVVSVLLYVRLAERRPFSSIGFHPIKIWDIPLAVAAGVIIVAGLAGIYYFLFPILHLDESRQVNQLAATPFWWRLISVIRAAVGEEILFRGYAIERGQELSGSLAISASFSCLVFTFEHVGPWGWSHLLLAGFGGLLLTLLYLWRRNLWVNIVAHFIVDGVATLSA